MKTATTRALHFVAAGAVILAAIAAVVLRLPSKTVSLQAPVEKLSSLAARGPLLMFLSTATGSSKQLSALTVADSQAARFPNRCERLAASDTYIVCVERSGNLLHPFKATLMNHDLDLIKSVSIEGVPSRARVSPDGRYFATTSFVTGDSYAAEFFSTRTVIFGTDRETSAGVNLESFDLVVNGQHTKYADTNIWGVTFVAGQNRFFATASFNSHRYLVDGDLSARSMLVLRENAECPSLSPNGLKIAYKKRVSEGQYPKWRFHVLNLETSIETPLGETRSVDDQIAWQDDDTVLYAAPSEAGSDIWRAPADGGPPEMIIRGGISPQLIGMASSQRHAGNQ